MANLFQPSLQRLLDENGNPVPEGAIAFYLTGTTTPATYYTDHAGTAAGPSPLPCDAGGRPIYNAYLDPDVIYRIRFLDADGAAVRPDVDPVRGYDVGMVQTAAEEAAAAASSTAADRVIVLQAKADTLAAKTAAQTAQADAEDAVEDAADQVALAEEAASQALAAKLLSGKFQTWASRTTPPAGVADGATYTVVSADGLSLILYLNTSGTGAPDPSGAQVATPLALTTALEALNDALPVPIDPATGVATGGLAGVEQRAFTAFDRRTGMLVTPAVGSELDVAMRRTIVGWGHSAMEGGGDAVHAVPDKWEGTWASPVAYQGILARAQTDLGWKWRCIGKGLGLQQWPEIAGRAGAVPVTLTVSGGTIPASGAVALTAINPPLLNAHTSGSQFVPGTINGVLVMIGGNGSGGHTVQQIDGTGDIAVAGGGTFIPSTDGLEHAINLIWADRNTQTVAAAMAYMPMMTRRIAGGRFLIWGTWNFDNEGPGSPNYIAMDGIHAYYQQAYGERFYNFRAFLRGDFPYNGTIYQSAFQLDGISPSVDDLADIAAGLMPRHYFWQASATGPGSNPGHPNEAGYDVIWRGARKHHLDPLGWLA